MLEYKGYIARVDLNEDAAIFHGEVINTRDVITFQGETVRELHAALEDSIEDYLEFCAERNEKPEKPFSGKFMLRIEPDLHRQVYIAAKKTGKSLNQFVSDELQHVIHT